MRDINGEEFQKGDTLKVIKHVDCGSDFSVGDVVRCIKDDGSSMCKFQKVGTLGSWYYPNDHLQKL